MAAEGGVQLGPKTRSFCILIKYSTWSDSDRCYNSSSLFRTAKVIVVRSFLNLSKEVSMPFVTSQGCMKVCVLLQTF